MEMPINVFITLFVAIAVAILVLQLSSQIIGQGEQQLQQFNLECVQGVDFFVETAKITPGQVGSLVELCYNQNIGEYSGNTICYIMHGDISGNLREGINSEYLDDFEVGDAGKTIYIKFDELTQKVDVTG